MSHYMTDLKHARWDFDISSYISYKKVISVVKNEFYKDFCNRRMTEIRSRWPNVHDRVWNN